MLIRGRRCALLPAIRQITMPVKSQQRSLTSFFAPKTDSNSKIAEDSQAGSQEDCSPPRLAQNSKTSQHDKSIVSLNNGELLSAAATDFAGSKRTAAESAQQDAQVKRTKALSNSPLKEEGWATAMAAETSKFYFQRLQSFLDAEYKSKVIYPPREQIFSAFESCPLANVKVVILGQDPYHGPNQAHGLAFSVGKGLPQPPSLKNMIKEAVSCCGIKPTKAGNLDSWCQQGVLLINSVLTVEQAKPNSHQKKGWESFTDAVIRELNKGDRRLVFMLWGKPSQRKGSFIDSTKHRVLTCAHPSPLSAMRGPDPFIGSSCFSKANEALTELGHDTVEWNVEA